MRHPQLSAFIADESRGFRQVELECFSRIECKRREVPTPQDL